MILFEDRSVEALYIQQSKDTKRAKAVPVVVTVVACVLGAITLFQFAGVDQISFMVLEVVALCLVTVVGVALSFAQKCHPRVQYHLPVATLGVAVAAATGAFICASLGIKTW